MDRIRWKRAARARRKKRVRAKIRGTADRPRVCVRKSNKYVYAQMIDDTVGRTVTAVSSLATKKNGSGKSVSVCLELGRKMGQAAKEKGISRAVFDRNGYPYKGRIKALAEGIRKAGIQL